MLPTFDALAVDAIAALYQLCEGVHEFKHVCRALLLRYESLWDSMKTLETQKLLPKSTVMPQFSESLGTGYREHRSRWRSWQFEGAIDTVEV